jgi:P27 family predicted phage terminase small subunit
MDSPPEHLQAAGRELWQRISTEFHCSDAAGQALLATACEALDRARMAQAVILAEGMTVPDRYGGSRPHPCIAIEKDAHRILLAALRQLNLDAAIVPKREPGRPAYQT